MKTLFYPEYGRLEIAEQETPRIAPDEVLLEVAACGVCGSELETFKNRSPRRQPPLVMGHEFCGTIAEVGSDVEGWKIGQQVVSNSLVPCDNCVRCQRGDTHLCAHRQIFGMHRPGAFAQSVNVPARCLLEWPQGLPAFAACLAEPMGNGVHMVHLTRHLKPQRVLVIGAGPIGLMAAGVYRVLEGAEITVADLSDERLEAARRVGATTVINSRCEDVVQLVRDATEGEGVDLVIDAVGAGVTKNQSVQAARPGGAALWIGLHENAISFDSYDITLPERQILGTYAATMSDLREAIELLASNQIDLSWVQSFSLDAGVEAFERMLAARGGDIKAVLTPGE
ncbi:MAG TPA: alcohol dehydrogenase catalytic domain-containing protein [Abditibacterium sp.]|jgi:L-iditol 2-dehydrogenase